MDFLRCLIAGVASLVIGVVLLAFSAAMTLMFLSPGGNGGAISFDPAAVARTPIAWIVALLLFAVGFIGEYRRSV